MITGKGETIDRIVGLELGADDYISNHFMSASAGARALGARTSRRSLSASAEPVTQIFVSPIGSLLRQAGASIAAGAIPSTTAEFDLLAILVQRPTESIT